MTTFKEFLNESWLQKRVGSMLISSFTEPTRDKFIEKYADAVNKFANDVDLPKIFKDQSVHVRVYKSAETRQNDDMLVAMMIGIPDGMDANEFTQWSKLVAVASKHIMDVSPHRIQYRNKSRAYWHTRDSFADAIRNRRKKPDQTDGDSMELDFHIQL